MGTIFIYRNMRVMIFANDHRPPHVHVIAPGARAVFNLYGIELVRSTGFDTRAINKIESFLTEKRLELMEAWHEIHGKEKD